MNTDRMWKRWGEVDPYYGVLAHPRFSTAAVKADEREFFATGEAFIDHLLQRYERHFGPLPRGRALDHGCGVGRLTLPLARRFGEVVGLDVAPGMLAEAQTNAARQAAGNLRFALADDGLSEATGRFDFVNSYIVLQHVPVRRGVPIALRLVDKVRPGGGFQLHLSVRTDGRASRSLWWASAHVPGVKIVQNVMAGRTWNAPAMQMNDYPLGTVLTGLAERGIAELQVGLERHAKFVTCSILGRRPPD